jgi:hypothetical protein
MSTAAYITALTIGMFAVITASANAAQEPNNKLADTVIAAPAVVTDPLVKYKDAKSLTKVELVELLDATQEAASTATSYTSSPCCSTCISTCTATASIGSYSSIDR